MKTNKQIIDQKTSVKTLVVSIFMGALLSSCLFEERGRAGLPRIQEFQSTDGDIELDENCTGGYVDAETLISECHRSCPDGTHEADEAEQDDAISAAIDINTLSDDEINALAEYLNGIAGICVPDIVRPDEQIYVRNDYCSCNNSTPDIVNDCNSFCAGRNTEDKPLLFGTVDLGPEVALNDLLGNLHNWCSVEIGDGNVQPECKLELYDGTGKNYIDINTVAGANTFTADLSFTETLKTYVARIVEMTSGSRSRAFQVFRIPAQDPTDINGPLKIMPVSQYTCLNQSYLPYQNGTVDFINSVKLHFYFAINNMPAAQPPRSYSMVCHDPTPPQTTDDNQEFPRLELIPQHFALWDTSDVRFYDLGPNGSPNGKRDANDEIERRLLNEYSIVRSVNIFFEFKWANAPSLQGTPPTIGLAMNPWIRSTSGIGFCPTQADYNGQDPTFRVMKELVGVDTEGIFIGLRQAITVRNAQGQDVTGPIDVLFIRETDLKRVWFYLENGQKFIPNEVTAGQKTVMFYWPLDPANPLDKKSYQHTYTIIRPEDLSAVSSGGSGGSSTGGIPTTARPPDKRYACIPKVGN